MRIFDVDNIFITKAKIKYLKSLVELLEDKKDNVISRSILADSSSKWFFNKWITEIDEEINRRERSISFLKKQLSNNEDDFKIEVSLDEIKSQIKIKNLLENAGVKIGGNNFFKIRNEDTPSAHFNEEKNMWHDFGSGEGGSVIDLYMKLYQKTLPEAIKELKTMM